MLRNVFAYESNFIGPRHLPPGPGGLDLVSPEENDPEDQSCVPDRPMQVAINGCLIGELPRVVRYRETGIGCGVGALVIGAADVAIPGEGVRTVYGARLLRDSDSFCPLEVSGEALYVGAFTSAVLPYPSIQAPNGWDRSARDLGADWYRKYGNVPDDVAKTLKGIRHGIVLAAGAGDETGFQWSHQIADYYIRTGRLPDKETKARLMETAKRIVAQHVADYYANKPSFLSGVTHPFAAAARWAGHSVEHAREAVENIPVVGPAIHTTLAFTPLGLATKIASGENISQAVVGDLKSKLAAIKDVAPYAETVVAMVPGVGTGVAAAIAASAALAQGKSITDSLITACRAAVPGGALGQMAFDTAQKIASGANVAGSVLEAARAQLPPEAQKAFDISLALAHGRKLQDALLDEVKSMGPAIVQKLGGMGLDIIAKSPELQSVEQAVSAAAKPGFAVASGLLSHTGVSPEMLVAARARLPKPLQDGFDAAVLAHGRIFPGAEKLVRTVAHPELAKAVLDSAKSLVNAKAGAAMRGLSVRIPGVTPAALEAYARASRTLDSLKTAQADVGEAERVLDLARREKRSLSPAEQTIVDKGTRAKKVYDSAQKSLGAMRALADKGDTKEQKRLAVLSAVKAARARGAGRHGHFISDTGQIILKGVWAPA